MFDSYSFASVAPCRYGSADDEAPMSPKQMSPAVDGPESFNNSSISTTKNKPSPIKASSDDPTLHTSSTPSPDILLASVEVDDGPDTDTDDHERRVAAAHMDIRRQRRQQHARFQSNPINVSRIRKLASSILPARQLPSATMISLQPPPLIPRDEPDDAKKDADREDRPISPDPNEDDEVMSNDEGFGEGDPFDDSTWSDTTLALWKVRASSAMRRRGYYESGGASQALLKCPRVVKSRPRMRRRRPEPPTEAQPQPQPPIDTATPTLNDGTAP